MNQQAQSLITEIEKKISETKQLITNQKQGINHHESTLKSLIKQLSQIKKTMKNNQNIAANSEINTK